MFKPLTPITAVAGLLSLGSCAASYTPIRPERINTYSVPMQREPVEVGSQIDALKARGAKKRYAKKEAKDRYHVTALRITNNTELVLTYGRDVILMSGSTQVTPVAPAIAASDMKQGVFIYLLYLLLNPTVGSRADFNPNTRQTTTTGGTVIPLGPFIAAGNILGASLANKNFRRNLEDNDPANRTINPGATIYGIVTLRDVEASSLHLVLR